MKSYSGADSEVGSKTALNHREEGVKRQCEILLVHPVPEAVLAAECDRGVGDLQDGLGVHD